MHDDAWSDEEANDNENNDEIIFPLPPTTSTTTTTAEAMKKRRRRATTTIRTAWGLKLLQAKTGGGDVAQWVERRTGTSLRQVRFPGVARDFSPRVNFQNRLSYGVRTALVCNHMH